MGIVLGPPDARLLSVSEMFASLRRRAERSRTWMIETASIRVEASRDNAVGLVLMLSGVEAGVASTHWSFTQLVALVGAPTAYLRQFPAPFAATCALKARSAVIHLREYALP